jgi:hypothetical protein
MIKKIGFFIDYFYLLIYNIKIYLLSEMSTVKSLLALLSLVSVVLIGFNTFYGSNIQ